MLWWASGFAQGTNGSLTGKVTDEQGLALPGVSVTATNQDTGFQRSGRLLGKGPTQGILTQDPTHTQPSRIDGITPQSGDVCITFAPGQNGQGAVPSTSVRLGALGLV